MQPRKVQKHLVDVIQRVLSKGFVIIRWFDGSAKCIEREILYSMAEWAIDSCVSRSNTFKSSDNLLITIRTTLERCLLKSAAPW